ncbi:copper amine oxidase-like protein [Thermodesulfitimonas autotrophica]|uniref:Copper amine oxidase-like protein n=1 Tax=Thermodesulfitimonas autotrophica TaxID=1894989 RepID=A0A3N5BMX7_9THEO|nr:copper amine oxidase N-terminal domain-containing protein [Thermodesulfitimonas autotrophica]RPF47105.1 copper amine oxidase-like protein [Thermodesulfitimonas autotrophica]
MKRAALVAILVGFLLFFGFAAAGAWQNVRLFVNGREIYPDVPPQIINGRTLVPLRAVAEALGADVRWDGNNKTVYVYRSSNDPNSYKAIADRLYLDLARLDDSGAQFLKRLDSPLSGSPLVQQEALKQVIEREKLLKEALKLSPPREAEMFHLTLVKVLNTGITGWSLIYELASVSPPPTIETEYLNAIEKVGWMRVQQQESLDALHKQLFGF